MSVRSVFLVGGQEMEFFEVDDSWKILSFVFVDNQFFFCVFVDLKIQSDLVLLNDIRRHLRLK